MIEEKEKCAICGKLTSDDRYFVGQRELDAFTNDSYRDLARVCNKCGDKLNV